MNSSFHNTLPAKHVAPPAVTSDSDDDIVDLKALLNIVWRGKWIIGLTAFLGVLLGFYYAYVVADQRFVASSIVILETNQQEVVDLGSVFPGLSSDDTAINSEVEVMKSRGLLGKVVDELNLAEDPFFNPTLVEPSLSARLKQQVVGWISSPGPKITLSEEEAQASIRNLAINNVLEAIAIRNLPETLVFEVRATTDNARKSALLADTLVETYIADQIQVKQDQTEQATDWLSERVAELQTELETAEARVKAFNATTDLVSEETLLATERQLKDIRIRIDDSSTIIASLEARLAAAATAETYAAKAALYVDERLSGLLGQINTAGMAGAFDLRFAQLVDRDRVDLTRAQSQLNVLQSSQETLTRQIEQQNNDLIQLQQLTREAEATRLLYEHFLTRMKETSAQQGIQKADSRLLSNAVTPLMPSEPRKSVIILMSLILGFFSGSAIVLFREMRQSTFRVANDLERKTGYMVMGQIPILPNRARKDVIRYLAEKPASAGAEAIRNLRTSVLLADVETPPQVIGTTSSLPGEGKTTLSLALAQNFTGLGKRVLIIEGDIRRRVFSQYLDTSQKVGMISVLSGTHRLADVVLKDERIGADLLIGEESSNNAADLFSSEAFSQMISEARSLYDTIIIDTPPVLVVPDARIVAQHVDAMLFVVAWDRTSRSQVQEALHMFETSGQKINGLVLNLINPKGMRSYGYGGKYGAYASYGQKYYVN